LGAAELGAVEPGATGVGDAAASGLEPGEVELGGEEKSGVAAGLGDAAGGLGVVGAADWARAVWISANGIQNRPRGETAIARRETTGEEERAIDLAVENLDGINRTPFKEFSDRNLAKSKRMGTFGIPRFLASLAKIKFFLSKYLFKHKICRLYIF
jgi:hypothetical protein